MFVPYRPDSATNEVMPLEVRFQLGDLGERGGGGGIVAARGAIATAVR